MKSITTRLKPASSDALREFFFGILEEAQRDSIDQISFCLGFAWGIEQKHLGWSWRQSSPARLRINILNFEAASTGSIGGDDISVRVDEWLTEFRFSHHNALEIIHPDDCPHFQKWKRLYFDTGWSSQ